MTRDPLADAMEFVLGIEPNTVIERADIELILLGLRHKGWRLVRAHRIGTEGIREPIHGAEAREVAVIDEEWTP